MTVQNSLGLDVGRTFRAVLAKMAMGRTAVVVRLLAFVAVVSAPFAPAVYAQSAKPADVLNVIEVAEMRIQKLYAADLRELSVVADLNIPPRRPRHVYRKAVTVFLKLQTLRHVNGLPETPLPPVPSDEITPGNAREMVALVDAQLTELMPYYWVTADVTVPPVKGNITPTDVYQALNRLERHIEGLGIPAVVPNDVYRVVARIETEVEALHGVLPSRAFDASSIAASSGKSPADAYRAGYLLLQEIEAFTKGDGKSIPDGVVLPDPEVGEITPATVLELANTILAELGAMKSAYGYGALVPAPPPPAGMTPSRVFDGFTRSQAYLKAIR